MKIQILGSILCFFSFFYSGFAYSSPQPRSSSQALQLFEKVDQHYKKVHSMNFKVERSIERGLQSQSEKWQVILQKPDFFRVEAEGPPERILVSRGSIYAEYIPQAKKALEMDISKLNMRRQKEFYNGFIPRVAIPGFHLSISPDILQRLNFRMVREEEFQGRPSFFIEGRADSKKVGSNGKSADEGKMRIWLDRERYTLLRMELYDGDVFLNSIENKGFRKFSADIWLPNHVEVKNSTATSLEKATYRLSRMIINEPIAEGTFQMHYAKGVEVMRENTQEGMVPKSVQGKPDFSSSTP